MNTAGYPILNPDVYLNYLPPPRAAEFEVTRNLYFITIGALIWDTLLSLPEDVEILRGGMTTSVLPYFLARLSALGFAFCSIIAKTRPVRFCQVLSYFITSFWVLASGSSSVLFFLRVRAVFHDSEKVRLFYLILLIANLGSSSVVIIGSRSAFLANTGFCLSTGLAHYVVLAVLMRLVFDSCVFLGITSRVIKMHEQRNGRVAWWNILKGQTATKLTRALLLGGQQYFIITVASNIIITFLVLIPSVPPEFEIIFSATDLTLASSMACRVFRQLKKAAREPDTFIPGTLFAEMDQKSKIQAAAAQQSSPSTTVDQVDGS